MSTPTGELGSGRNYTSFAKKIFSILYYGKYPKLVPVKLLHLTCVHCNNCRRDMSGNEYLHSAGDDLDWSLLSLAL